MLKVGFITANHFPRLGGMEMAVHHLANALHQTNEVKVAVACATMPEVPKDFAYPYPCYRSKSFSVLTPYLFQRNQSQMIQKEKPQILHGPMLHGGGFWAMEMAQKFSLPFVAHSHGSDVQLVPEIGYGACLNPVVKKKIQTVLKQADKLIAVSSINKQNMVDLGALPENISVIPNGVHFNEIQSIPFKNLRPTLGLNDDDFVLITVGRNRPIKRMELLFQALRQLKEMKAIKCLCVGPIEDLQRLASKHSVEHKVIFTGRIPKKMAISDVPPYPQLINLYRQANLYISTSYVESFGNTAADALACGIPILVGVKHGVRDIVMENETGWVMDKETPEELAEMILALYHQRDELSNSAKVIKNSVSALTWEHIAEQTAVVYKNIL